MSGFEEETYSTIFTSLKHPVRRKILRMLSEKPRNFSEMLEALRISSSHLTYHLENLGELVSKTKNGKYNLSKFGEAAVETMSRVEETPRATQPKRPPSLPIKWKSFFVMLMIALVVLSGVGYTQYQSLKRLSAEYEELEWLVELVEKGGSLESKYTLKYISDKSEFDGALHLRFQVPYCLIYNINDNSTLDLALSISTVLSETPLSISVQVGNVFDRATNETAPVIWAVNATTSSLYSVPLASKGWYTISLVGPIRKFLTASGKVTGYSLGPMPSPFEDVDCSMSLRIIHEGDYSPFIVGETYP